MILVVDIENQLWCQFPTQPGWLFSPAAGGVSGSSLASRASQLIIRWVDME